MEGIKYRNQHFCFSYFMGNVRFQAFNLTCTHMNIMWVSSGENGNQYQYLL
jgi:hypothetical protein